MDSARPPLERFIERILAEQEREDGEPLDEASLARLARRQGLSDYQWRALREQAEDHRTRGRRFSDHGNWDAAIEEWEQAYVITPWDVSLRCDLGKAHAHRFRETRRKADRTTAERYLRGCIREDPGHGEAFEKLTELERSGRTNRTRTRLAWGLVSVALLAAVIAKVVLPLMNPTGPGSLPDPGTGGEPDPVTTPPSQARDPGKSRLSVRFEGAPSGADFSHRIERSELNRYPGKFGYQLSGVLRPEAIEITAASAVLELVGPEGEVAVRHEFEIFPDYRSGALPGDTIPFRALVFENRPAPALEEARITFENFVFRPFDGDVEPGTEITWSEGNGTMPVNARLKIHERSAQRTGGGLIAPGMATLRLNLTVTNAGERALRLLAFHPLVEGTEGETLPVAPNPVVGSIGPSRPPGHFYAVSVSDPPLMPGERRPLDVIVYIPDADPGDIGPYSLVLDEVR